MTAHASLDLDEKAIEAALKLGDWAEVTKVYTLGGGNSVKSGPKNRYLAGFSKGIAANGKMNNWADYKKYAAYWTAEGVVGDYADAFVQTGLTDATMDVAQRVEIVKKGIVYQSVWMYVIHEMEDAIADCEKGAIAGNDKAAENQNAVHAWDEAWAFYAGSQQTAAKTDGYMCYTLAQKRCGNFGTCDKATGLATVNKNLLVHFNSGRDLLEAGECADAKVLVRSIVKEMTIPLIQGALRYAYKADPWLRDQRATKCAAGVKETPKPKEAAEGWAFAAAVLPQLDTCDKVKAKMIKDNLDIASKNPMKDGYAKVYHAMQSMYPCLGITCADIGGLISADDAFYKFAGTCVDADAAKAFVPDTSACPAPTAPTSPGKINADGMSGATRPAATLAAVALVVAAIARLN